MDTTTPSATSDAAPKRSASVGAIPREKKHYTSRVESTSGGPLDVRCACQYFQCDSLLPERINPVGSRSESQQGYATGIPQQLSEEFLLQTPNKYLIQFDQVSTKSCVVPGRVIGDVHHSDADRISAKSFGGQKTFDEISNRSFGGYQDLDEIKRRGLVVRSISDATDPGGMAARMEGPVLSRNQREMSTDRMSNKSFGKRDPDTISTRSGIELRRISRPESQQDLFVADINVPMQYGIHSRRSSKTELPHFNIIAPTPTPTIGMKKPEFSVYEEFRQNKVALEQEKENLPGSIQNNFKQNQHIPIYQPTDSHSKEINTSFNTSINMKQQSPTDEVTGKMSKEVSPYYTTSADIQKQNQSVLVYSPSESINTEMNPSYNSSPNLMKQNQSIPVYQATEKSNSDITPSYNTSQNIMKQNQSIPVSVQLHSNTKEINLPANEVNTKEINTSSGAFQNILKQNQPIPIYEPPNSQVSKQPTFNISIPQLEKVYQETTVPITKIEVPVMSIEMKTIITEHHVLPEAPPIIVKAHPEKNSISTLPSQISDISSFPPSPTLQELKRPHGSDFENSPIEMKQKSLLPTLPESENKSKIGSRQSSFRRFFGSKQKPEENELTDDIKLKEKIQDSPLRERTPMRFFGKREHMEQHSAVELRRRRENSKSPSRDRSPGRILGKTKPELIMMSSNNNKLMSMSVNEPMKMTLSDSKSNQPTSTTVHETFSLKVDELDQYSFKPKKIISSTPLKSVQNLKVSNINLSDSQKATENWNDPINQQPLINFQAYQPQPLNLQSRKMTSSQPDISVVPKSGLQHIFNLSTNPPTQQKYHTNENKGLVSVNIGIDDPEYMDGEETIESYIVENKELFPNDDHEKFLITRQIMDPSSPRAPSEQRIMQSALLRRKNYFDRTRSQDRTNSSQESANDLLSGRMMKTVSFDFAGHRSRIDEMEKLTRTSSKASDKNDWLEKTYFKR